MATPAWFHARSIRWWATGMGTSFGLGMYLDVPHTLPMLIGGIARDKWEDKKLKPRIDAIKEKEGAVAAEKQRALICLEHSWLRLVY